MGQGGDLTAGLPRRPQQQVLGQEPAAGGAVEVQDGQSLAAAVQTWLSDCSALDQARDAARSVVLSQAAALDGVVDLLIETLNLQGPAPSRPRR